MTKKLITGLFIACFFSQLVYSQKIDVEKIKKHPLVYLLNNIRDIYKQQNDSVLVNVYIVSNKSGSAKLPESDEVTNDIYIAIAEFDENPKQLLYRIRNIIGVADVLLKKNSDQSITLSFTYLDKEDRKKVNAGIGTNGVLLNMRL